MNQYFIETILGLLTGAFLGVTGIAPMSLLLIAFEYLKIGDYKSNLGTIIFLNLFPITAGSVYEFWEAKKINFTMGFILLISVIIGSFLGSKLVLNKKDALSAKTIKYITSGLGFVIFSIFLYSAYYEEN
jgi:uncharacterized membrane protein YfcA